MAILVARRISPPARINSDRDLNCPNAFCKSLNDTLIKDVLLQRLVQSLSRKTHVVDVNYGIVKYITFVFSLIPFLINFEQVFDRFPVFHLPAAQMPLFWDASYASWYWYPYNDGAAVKNRWSHNQFPKSSCQSAKLLFDAMVVDVFFHIWHTQTGRKDKPRVRLPAGILPR